MRRHNLLLILFVTIALMARPGLQAQQEHPKEHPKKQQEAKQEHPKKEHPAAKPTTDDLDKAIRDQIAEKAKASGGKFPAKDDVLNKTWALELVRVHKDKLTQLDDNTYFACVDFKADDSTAVDVDFYLKGDAGKLKITDTTVHKVNGKARFMYQQKGNFWERVKASS